MPTHQSNLAFRLRTGLLLNLTVSLLFALASVFLIRQVSQHAKAEALHEAEAKARIILERNMATHAYFATHLKPKIFALTDAIRPPEYFEPAWMSSTYAVREIDSAFRKTVGEDYFYKECAINARSPENEADAFESAFIRELNADPTLRYRSLVRDLDGRSYFVVLRRGEAMEEGCLRCHSEPGRAPGNLVAAYGPERSFHRSVGETVSAISIRIPLTEAYHRAEALSRHLASLFVGVLAVVFLLQALLYQFLVGRPLAKLHEKAVRFVRDEGTLGETLPLPAGREFLELTETFNAMSIKLRSHMDHLESLVEERTAEKEQTIAELQKAMSEISTLRGILPICSFCKKVRDDQGYWEQVDIYIHKHSEADVSHGICPDCLKEHYPEEYDMMRHGRSSGPGQGA